MFPWYQSRAQHISGIKSQYFANKHLAQHTPHWRARTRDMVRRTAADVRSNETAKINAINRNSVNNVVLHR